MLGLRHLQDVNYASARAPFYVTSRGYGLYVQSEAQGRYAVAVKGGTVVSFDDDRLRYSLIYGPSYLEVFRRYNDLAGGSVMPPTWAFDSIWWRDDNHADWEENGVSSSQALALHDADMLAKHRIRASALWLDRPYGTGRRGWGNMDFDETFPDPAAMIQTLEERVLHRRKRGDDQCHHRRGRVDGRLLRPGRHRRPGDRAQGLRPGREERPAGR
jgi:alpha-D-xyloside xylohydrolase